MAEARANARLALMMAIGQLQKELGPDSRISAPYGQEGGDSAGQPHWTAAYDAWEVQDPTGSQPQTPGSREVTFRDWLSLRRCGDKPG